MARHVCHVHWHGRHPGAGTLRANRPAQIAPPVELALSHFPVGGDGIKSPEFMRSYIAAARQVEPSVPDHLISYVTDAYVNMRAYAIAELRPHYRFLNHSPHLRRQRRHDGLVGHVGLYLHHSTYSVGHLAFVSGTSSAFLTASHGGPRFVDQRPQRACRPWRVFASVMRYRRSTSTRP